MKLPFRTSVLAQMIFTGLWMTSGTGCMVHASGGLRAAGTVAGAYPVAAVSGGMTFGPPLVSVGPFFTAGISHGSAVLESSLEALHFPERDAFPIAFRAGFGVRSHLDFAVPGNSVLFMGPTVSVGITVLQTRSTMLWRLQSNDYLTIFLSTDLGYGSSPLSNGLAGSVGLSLQYSAAVF